MSDINSLIDRYRETIESVETQSCHHGPDGSMRKGDDWASCCGVSYEYVNDIAVRDRIAAFMKNDSLTTKHRELLNNLDNRLKVLLQKNGFATQSDSFWKQGLPYGVKP